MLPAITLHGRASGKRERISTLQPICCRFWLGTGSRMEGWRSGAARQLERGAVEGHGRSFLGRPILGHPMGHEESAVFGHPRVRETLRDLSVPKPEQSESFLQRSRLASGHAENSSSDGRAEGNEREV